MRALLIAVYSRAHVGNHHFVNGKYWVYKDFRLGVRTEGPWYVLLSGSPKGLIGLSLGLIDEGLMCNLR